MSNISAAQVKELREKTGLGLMDCKKALEDAEGNMDKAIEELRKTSGVKASKKSGRSAADGLIAIKNIDDQIFMIEVNCETDFVARDDSFVEFTSQTLKFFSENPEKTLQELMDDGVEDNREKIVQKLGENIVVRRGEIGLTQYVIKNKKYSHGSLINSEILEDFLKDLSRDALLRVSRETIIENASLRKFKSKFIKNIDSFSKDELIAFILIQVSRQIIVFSLIKFLIEDLKFPFLKKMLFKLDKPSAEEAYKIIKSLDKDVYEEILFEINTNEALKRFLFTN